MKSARKRLIDRLDTLWSNYIRLRDKRISPYCPFHSNIKYITFNNDVRYIEQANHMITRSKYSVRWDIRNGVGCCRGCNLRYEHDQSFIYDVVEWYKKRYGTDQWMDLKVKSTKVAKFSNDDLLNIKNDLEERLQYVARVT